jgi:hypothetical protein
MRIAPFLMSGPAAVRILTLRMTVGRDGNGTYVLGNGSASGVEVAPSPTAAAVVSRGVGDWVVCGFAAAQAAAPSRSKQFSARMEKKASGKMLWVGQN